LTSLRAGTGFLDFLKIFTYKELPTIISSFVILLDSARNLKIKQIANKV